MIFYPNINKHVMPTLLEQATQSGQFQPIRGTSYLFLKIRADLTPEEAEYRKAYTQYRDARRAKRKERRKPPSRSSSEEMPQKDSHESKDAKDSLVMRAFKTGKFKPVKGMSYLVNKSRDELTEDQANYRYYYHRYMKELREKKKTAQEKEADAQQRRTYQLKYTRERKERRERARAEGKLPPKRIGRARRSYSPPPLDPLDSPRSEPRVPSPNTERNSSPDNLQSYCGTAETICKESVLPISPRVDSCPSRSGTAPEAPTSHTADSI